MYQLSAAGLAFVKLHEGFRPHAYQDSAGVWTIGYGHTGPDVHAGLVVTEPYAEHLLLADIQAAVACVNHAVTVTLAQEQFDALVDFAFNAGATAFLHSTLLEDLNRGDYQLAASQFGRWVFAGGVVVPGLVTRRKAECDLFLNTYQE